MTTLLQSAERTAFQLGFQVSPIIFVGGIASYLGGGYLPIISITEPLNLVNGLIAGSYSATLDDFFAQYLPLPGGTLFETQLGKYPLANQSVAANATINQPLRISLKMICPVRQPSGWISKLAIFTALQTAIKQHSLMGGTYIVVTQACIYQNCVLLSLRDTSSGDTKQVQSTWQWDFEQPLITLQQAEQAQNNLMSQISNGLPTDGTTTGIEPQIGNATNVAAPSLGPDLGVLPGAGIQTIPVYPAPLAPPTP